MFFLRSEDQTNGLSDPADHSRLTENVAKAFCMALCPHLKLLKEDGMAKLGLRVTLDSDQVTMQAPFLHLNVAFGLKETSFLDSKRNS